ncbi:MAG TPA: XF1762 family protein [Steroidobacteraceae bacterium]|nr:XF1762 family protein [Steroidobacteraceae bacterium]
MTALSLRPMTRDDANVLVRQWHSHHKPVVGHCYAIGCYRDSEPCGAVIVGRPVAPALQDGLTFEVTRLVTDRTPHAASKLLGAAWRAARAMGCKRMISYVRADEAGACYLAAGWRPVASVRGEAWTHGNKAARWLPGLYEPSSEIVDRVRWEVAAA